MPRICSSGFIPRLEARNQFRRYILSDLIFSDSFINGEFYQTSTRFSVDDPATEQSIVDVSDIDEQGVNAAINAAKGAFVKLKATNATERSETLMRW